MDKEKESKKKVLEDLITAMEDRESGAKIKGAKPLLQIMIAGGESEDISDEEIADEGELSDDEEAIEGEGMPAGLAEIIAKKKREQRGE